MEFISIGKIISHQRTKLTECGQGTCLGTFTDEQYTWAKAYIEDMHRHPQRVFWRGKEEKTEDELVVEQIAHRILSGFYNNDPFRASQHILRMDSMAAA